MSENIEAAYDLIRQVAQMANLIPLETSRAVLAEFDRMDTLMPILDPTGYKAILKMKGGHEDLARAFHVFRLAIEKLKQEAM